MRDNEGKMLHGLARHLLVNVRGFVRWSDAPDALLVSDVNRHETSARALDALNEQGFRIWQRDGLTWLDAPDDAYTRALAARWQGERASGAPLALCALRDDLLRQPSEQADTPDARRLIRAAWQALSAGDALAVQWADSMRREAATRMREGRRDGLYACGVLLAQFVMARPSNEEASR